MSRETRAREGERGRKQKRGGVRSQRPSEKRKMEDSKTRVERAKSKKANDGRISIITGTKQRTRFIRLFCVVLPGTSVHDIHHLPPSYRTPQQHQAHTTVVVLPCQPAVASGVGKITISRRRSTTTTRTYQLTLAIRPKTDNSPW